LEPGRVGRATPWECRERKEGKRRICEGYMENFGRLGF